jgi:tetratricopeptide (TPR) repeat protein
MTEALITELGNISALRLISHQSVMQYKGTKKSVPQIARELNVEVIVEGSIIRAGDQVRITVQLIDGRTDRHLWADSYQREMRGILSLQNDVAKAIATEVKVKLTPQEEKLLASAHPVNPEAHEAYVKGLYYVNRWPEPESVHCIESFQRATDIEPTFADAQAGLATCYTVMPWTLPPKEVYPRAKTAAKEAIRLDANQAEAYAALGAVNMFYEWDWGSAEQNLRRAVELNPNRSYSRAIYSNYFAFLGRTEEAIREAKEAVLLDPASILMNRNLVVVYLFSHKYPEYAAQAQTTLELAPKNDFARWDLAWAFALQGKRNWDTAIRLLEKAYNERDAEMVHLYKNPAFDSLRSDRRLQSLLGRMNFPK